MYGKLKLRLQRVISLITIFLILVSTILPYISLAEERPENVRVVTDKTEKETLLGIHDDNSVGVLGIAERFSVFSFGNLELKDTDIEGRVAVKGKLSATTDYEYQIGWKNEDDNSADIILGNGPIENIALNFGADDVGNIIDDTKIVAVSSNATNMNWSNYTDEELSNNFVESDLIDFDGEYNYLKNISQEFYNMEANGTINYYEYSTQEVQYMVTEDKLSDEAYNYQNPVTIFSGDNKDINVFSISTTDWNEKVTGAVAFDVPLGSKIIINVKPMGETYYPVIKINDKCGFFYLVDEEHLASQDLNKENLGYIYTDGDLLRHEDGNPKIFTRASPGKLKEVGTYNIDNSFSKEYAQNILWNMPNLMNVLFTEGYNGYCFMGTILALNADVSTINESPYFGGYLQGSLICKSYTGKIQIGYAPFLYDVKGSTQIDINKIDYDTEESVTGATLGLYKFNTDEDGNILFNDKIAEWTTNDTTKNIELDTGIYVLREEGSSVDYNNNSGKYFVFEVGNVAYYEGDELNYKLSAIVNNNETVINTTMTEYNAVLDSFPITWKELYGNLNDVLNSGKRVTNIEFKVDSVDDSIKDENLYVIVADTNGYDKGIDWVEFLKWTKTEIGGVVNTPVPVVSYFYPYKDVSGDLPNEETDWKNGWDDPSIVSFKPHFYIEDLTEESGAREVTDLVQISEIKAYWYDYQEETKSYTYEETFKNNEPGEKAYVRVNCENNEILVSNDHIKTTIDLSKVDKDEPTILLQGAVYELQDAEGNTLNTFLATNADGKSILSDLMLDVGKYYLVEKTAPAGYKLSDEKIEVVVKQHTSETIAKTVKDEKIKINVEKQDEYGNVLSGANLQILDRNNNIIKTWTSEDNIEVIEGLSVGEYTLHENYAPTGFVKAEDIQFTVTEQGKVLLDGVEVEKIVMTNKAIRGSISITKRGETLEEVSRLDKLEKYKVYKFIWKENPLKNVTYDLYAKNDILVNGTKVYNKDEKIASSSTGLNGIANYSGLIAGDYYIIEKSAPNQYEIDNEKHDISLIVTYDENNNQQLIATTGFINERKKETIELTKTEKNSEIAVEGAVYGLYNQEPIGSISENTLLDVVITNELGKGKFEADLPIGNYYVKEIEAPNGYLVSEESKYINFNESTDFKINVEDDFIKVNILKTDENGNALSDAKLQIVDEQGNIVVAEWISGKNAKEISKTFNVGEIYVLKELESPVGYAKADDKKFKILNTGDVQEIILVNDAIKVDIVKQNINGENVKGAELTLVDYDSGSEIESWTTEDTEYRIKAKLQAGKTYILKETKSPLGYATAKDITFTVKDTKDVQKIKMEEQTIKVQISKQDITTKEELEGAKLTLAKEDGTIIETWISEQTPHYIEGKLMVGENYTLTEEIAPDGYVKAEKITFKVEDTEKIQPVVMLDDYTKVKIEKTDEIGNYLKDAELQIVDKEGNVVHKWVTDDKPYELFKLLKAGITYTLEEISAPEGYEKAEPIEFKVSEDGKIDIVKLVNKKMSVEETPKEETPKEEIPKEETPKEKIPNILPKTGDKILVYGIIFIVILCCTVFIIDKNNKN